MINQTQAPTPKELAERKEARLKMWTAVLGLLTALFALLTGVFATKTGSAKTEVNTTQDQVKVLASKNAALEADNAQKDAKITQLQSDLAAVPSVEPSSDDPSPAGTPATPAVFHKGPLTLKPGGDADLDATVDDPQWRYDGSGNRSSDLYFNDSKVEGDSIWATTVLMQQDSTYATCRNATGYSENESYSVTKLIKAKTLCVITSENRYSVLRIKSASNGEVAFDVTTYAKDSD